MKERTVLLLGYGKEDLRKKIKIIQASGAKISKESLNDFENISESFIYLAIRANKKQMKKLKFELNLDKVYSN